MEEKVHAEEAGLLESQYVAFIVGNNKLRIRTCLLNNLFLQVIISLDFPRTTFIKY